MLLDAVRNHLSWFGRGREVVELDGVTVFLGSGDAVIAFPRSDGDLSAAVWAARESGADEVGCWAMAPDEELGARLVELGFRDGWQPHWMGIDPRLDSHLPAQRGVRETIECIAGLPYSSHAHERMLGGDVHHFVADDGVTVVGHTVLNIECESAGIYDMGVAPHARRRGHGRALVLAAMGCARQAGCTSTTLNATGEGELLYRDVGFASLGLGMTWWLFPKRQ